MIKQRMAHPVRGVLLATLASALWGLAPVALKMALAGYSPEIISPIRLGLAAVIFRALAGKQGRWLPRDAWSWIGGVGLGVDFILYNYGVRLTTAGVAGLVINVEVVATIALAVWLLGERLTRRRIIGSMVTLVGVLYVATEGASLRDLLSREHVLGNALIMLAGIAWSVFAVAQRRVPRRGSLFVLLAPIFSVAALTTVPLLILPSALRGTGGLVPTLMLVALLLLCTAAVYFIYARCQEMIDVSVLAVVLSSIPVFAVLFAWLLLGEPLSWRIVIGGAAILAGVLLISTESREAPEETLLAGTS
jgi:drug/metabolite transporter (DMT)-like permease